MGRVIDFIHAASGCATVKLWLQFLHGFASKNGSSLSVFAAYHEE
jgi:hypothetical protein